MWIDADAICWQRAGARTLDITHLDSLHSGAWNAVLVTVCGPCVTAQEISRGLVPPYWKRDLCDECVASPELTLGFRDSPICASSVLMLGYCGARGVGRDKWRSLTQVKHWGRPSEQGRRLDTLSAHSTEVMC